MPWPSETQRDTEVFALIDKERERQSTGLQLIASENFTSPDVMEATGSVLTNKYAEGYPGKRYYGGNAVVDDIEAIAIDRVKKLFGADHANVQPHSGASANMAVYLGLIKPGDTVLGLSLDHGGHLTHGSPVNASGILYNFQSFRVGDTDERLDFDQIRELAIKHKPKMIVAGATAYPRLVDFKLMREIADEVGAKVLFDAAHLCGMIAGKVWPQPLEEGAQGGKFAIDRTLAQAMFEQRYHPASNDGAILLLPIGKLRTACKCAELLEVLDIGYTGVS